MESETPSAGVVNTFDEKKAVGENLPPEEFPSEIPVELLDLTRRFNRYIEGTFANGKLYERMIDARRKFKRATGFSWDHVDRMSRVFMRWSTAYKFSRERHGRSTYIYIRPKRRPLVLSTAEVRRRLVGAIRAHVARWGSVHIDRKFLANFHALYGLAPEQITHAWHTIKFVEGCKCRWKGGTGRGQNLYVEPERNAEVSLRQKRRGISLPYGEERNENRGVAPESDPQTDRVFADGSPDPLDKSRESTSHRSGSTNGEDDSKPSGWPTGEGSPPKPPGSRRANHRWKPVRAPLHVCGRWIPAARIRRKAFWLVFNPIHAMAASAPGVRWAPGYAVNFCREALELGFLDSEICAAWRVGLDETQASAARDRDAIEERRDRVGWVTEEWRPRELSQCVARAWMRLRADERSDEERWSAIFSGGAKPAGAALVPPVAAPRASYGAERSSATSTRAENGAAAAARGEFRTVAPGLRVRMPMEKPGRVLKFKDGTELEIPKKYPDVTPAAQKAMGLGLTFEQYLKHRGMTLDAMLKLPRAAQQNFVREMHAWQKARNAPEQKDIQNPLL